MPTISTVVSLLPSFQQTVSPEWLMGDFCLVSCRSTALSRIRDADRSTITDASIALAARIQAKLNAMIQSQPTGTMTKMDMDGWIKHSIAPEELGAQSRLSGGNWILAQDGVKMCHTHGGNARWDLKDRRGAV